MYRLEIYYLLFIRLPYNALLLNRYWLLRSGDTVVSRMSSKYRMIQNNLMSLKGPIPARILKRLSL